jgi:hypothetical protein
MCNFFIYMKASFMYDALEVLPVVIKSAIPQDAA